MLRYRRRHKYSLISIYQSSSSICLLQLKRDGVGYHIQDVRLHVEQQPPLTGDNFPKILQTLMTKMKLKHKNAAIVIEDELAITKIVEVKKSLKNTYKEAEILLQAQQLIPYPLHELYYDFTVIDSYSSKHLFAKVLFVAVRRDHIDKRIELVEKAGLKVKYIDLQSLSILRTFHLVDNKPSSDILEQTIVLIDIQEKKITIKILNKFALIFAHEANISVSTYSNQNQEGSCITRKVHISNKNEQSLPTRESLTKKIIKLLDLTFDRYHTTQICHKPNAFIMTGDPNLFSDDIIQFIQLKFSMPCYLANPFIKINFCNAIEMQHLKLYAHHLIMCCGLALARWLGNSHHMSLK